jgi:hypothetical protein
MGVPTVHSRCQAWETRFELSDRLDDWLLSFRQKGRRRVRLDYTVLE